jgi:hypothetical protein
MRSELICLLTSSAKRQSWKLLAFSIFAVFLAACGDSGVKTYRVAKEDHHGAPPVQPAEAVGHTHSTGMPHVHANLPQGWEQMQPDGMRAAVYRVSGEEGRLAQVVVIPLRGASKIELESVNMWREEAGLEPLDLSQLKEQSKPVQVGKQNGQLFEMASSKPKAGQKFNLRTLGVILQEPETVWIIKMMGDDSLVAAQKEAFVSFLKSLSFHEQAHGEVAAAEAPVTTNTNKVPSSRAEAKFEVPANWSEKTPGPMVMTAYNVAGDANGQAEVTVSKFPGEVGGMVANVNRWRQQLGLQALNDSEARNTVKMLDVNGKKDAYMVDLRGTNARTGKAARMLSIGVPRSGETWFFKLMGDEAVVEKESGAFVKFVQSAY